MIKLAYLTAIAAVSVCIYGFAAFGKEPTQYRVITTPDAQYLLQYQLDPTHHWLPLYKDARLVNVENERAKNMASDAFVPSVVIERN